MTWLKKFAKLQCERDTTLTGLVRDYLKDPAAEHERTGRKRREQEALACIIHQRGIVSKRVIKSEGER